MQRRKEGYAPKCLEDEFSEGRKDYYFGGCVVPHRLACCLP
jgi:hypothetical protein